MLLIDGIHNSFLSVSELPIRFIQMLNALRHIHHRCHLLLLVVTVRSTLVQQRYTLHLLTFWRSTHIVKIRQVALVNERLNRPGLQQHVEQVRERHPVQPAWGSRQPEELRLRPPFPQPPVRLRQCMVCLVNDDQLKVEGGRLNVKFLYALHNHPILTDPKRPDGIADLL